MNYLQILAESKDIYELRNNLWKIYDDPNTPVNALPGILHLIEIANDTICQQLHAAS